MSKGYRNPVLPGFNPDPTVCRVGDDYYLATSTFEYFPGVPIYHSRDLVNWKLIGHALNRPSQLEMRTVEPGAGIYAPTLRYHKGRWYMTTASVFRQSQRTDFEVGVPGCGIRRRADGRTCPLAADSMYGRTTLPTRRAGPILSGLTRWASTRT